MDSDMTPQTLMQHPFQCIASLENGDRDLLLAACGASLLAYSTAKRLIVSKWSAGDAGTVTTSREAGANGSEERPAKKQKTEDKKASALSKIISIRVSPDQSHVVVVTEDKVVHVLNVRPEGVLTGLSQRAMPKRPCAVRVLPDSSTILIGDKFGDVYSLPLIMADPSEQLARKGAQETEHAEPALFKPSATPLTVHTKRNLRALESQRKQKIITPRKEPLAFDHQLLLGHVSMLTDMVYAKRETDGQTRRYILTADRDEHIRVSRGPPQSHIIEGYCLAHTEFVGKICLVPGTDLLVSGGGDDWLGIWDWLRCELLAKLDLRKAISGLLAGGDEKFAVSGIWTVPVSGHADRWALCVTCEKLPAMIFIDCSALRGDTPTDAAVLIYKIDGAPVLDVTHSGTDGGRIFVALDDRRPEGRRVHAIKVLANAHDDSAKASLIVSEVAELDIDLKQLSEFTGVLEDDKALDSFLYTTANLRKRGGWDEQEEA